MKWSFVIQQKIKAALLLTGIMAFIVLNTFISRGNINGINKSFSSIYEDRLVPAIDIVYLSENLYNKRLLLERNLFSTENNFPIDMHAKLKAKNQSIDSLITHFEKTLLVKEEAKVLESLKHYVKVYAALENDIIKLSEAGDRQAGSVVFNGIGADTFIKATKCLNELTKIQALVGQQLVKESKSESSQFDLISTLQIAIAIIIGLLIIGLIQNSKIINHERQPFHMN